MSSDDKSIKKSFPSLNIKNNEPLIFKLSNDLSYQKSYIKLLHQVIKNAISGNEKEISILEKINVMLPELIQRLGLPFCDLINNNEEIINYYIDIYLKKDKNSGIAKDILINYINIFNFQSIEVNPSVDLIERLQESDPETFKEIENNKRLNKSEIENLYDGLSDLFSTWRMSVNITENLENDFFQKLQFSLNEKNDKIKEMEKTNKYPKATIEFFKEKVKNCESSINKVNKSNTFEKKIDNQLFSPQINTNNICYHSNPNQNIQNHNQLNNIDISRFNLLNSNNTNNINNESEVEENLKKLREIPLKNRTSFYKDEILAEGEDEFTEFKHYFFPLNEKQGEELKRQFCGFLNGSGGRLYLGINDQKIVKGVVLNYKRCDALRNLLVNYTYDFYPKCRLDKIKVFFIPIKSMKDSKFINNLYIVKIIVLPGEPNILYSMTNKGFNSAMRLQGQCANLTAEEIFREIIKRGSLQNDYNNINLIKNNFNDPDPEKNFDVDNIIDDENDWIINDKKKNKNSENIEYPINKKKKVNKKGLFVVEVKNIDVNLETKDVYDIFEGCGSIYQKFFSKEGKSRGYGILKFTSEALARTAIDKFNQTKLGNNNIILVMKKNSN